MPTDYGEFRTVAYRDLQNNEEHLVLWMGALNRNLGIHRLRLMTNNPLKVKALADFGIDIAERVPHVISPRADNSGYLRTTARRLNHMLSFGG